MAEVDLVPVPALPFSSFFTLDKSQEDIVIELEQLICGLALSCASALLAQPLSAWIFPRPECSLPLERHLLQQPKSLSIKHEMEFIHSFAHWMLAVFVTPSPGSPTYGNINSHTLSVAGRQSLVESS